MNPSPWTNMEIPTPKWTPINDPSESTPINKLSAEKPNAFDATDVSNAGSSSTGLTDDEILAGGLDLLEGANLLQVASTHTNKEILAKINANHAKPVLSDNSLCKKITYALNKQSKLQGRPRENLTKELNDARQKNGVLKRRYADIGKKSGATKRANSAKRLKQAIEGTDENGEDEDLVGVAKIIETEDGHEDEERAALREECEKLAREGGELLVNDRLLKVAGVLASHEIVELANAGGKGKAISSALVSQRLGKAMDYVAERDGKLREVVKSGLEAARRTNGVLERQKKYACDRRAASQASKRAKKAGRDILQDAMNIDEEESEEDPLGDLEEMGYRVAVGSLVDEDSDSDVQPEPPKRVRGEEFPSRRPLPPRIDEINRRGVLPIVIDGFFRGYPEPDQLTQSMTGESLTTGGPTQTMEEPEATMEDEEMEWSSHIHPLMLTTHENCDT